MRILLVDDHVLLREGLYNLLCLQPDFEVVGEAGTVKQAVALAEALSPDLILMDFGLPDGTGLEATRLILARQPAIQIVFLTVHEDDDRLFDAVRAGARGYLLKNVPVARLVEYLRGLERGEAAITPALASRVLAEFAQTGCRQAVDETEFKGLTLREIEVLRELAQGVTNYEIASRLVISENTVKNHVRNILAKLHLRNRREAAIFARQQGL